MLYVFTWTDSYSVWNHTQKWKKLFCEKHGDFNLTHIKNLSEVDTNFLAESLLSNSLFASKKLIIIDVDPSERKTVETEKKQEFLLTSLQKISEDTIVVVSYGAPDKRSKFYKWLIKIAEKVEVFDQQVWSELSGYLQRRYRGVVSAEAINLLIRYKSGNKQKITGEIEKLLISYPSVDIVHVRDHIFPELDESIFTLVDSVLARDTKNVFETLRILSENTNIYMIYNSLLANLRTSYYISLLKYKKIPPTMIRTSLKLGNRGFLVDRTPRMDFSTLGKLYNDLICVDRSMKTGKLIGSSEEDILFEIERVLCRYI